MILNLFDSDNIKLKFNLASRHLKTGNIFLFFKPQKCIKTFSSEYEIHLQNNKITNIFKIKTNDAKIKSTIKNGINYLDQEFINDTQKIIFRYSLDFKLKEVVINFRK